MSVSRFFFRKRSDEELRLEIEEHIEFERDLNLERGLGEKEAARQALIKFGSRQRVREEIWRMNSVTFFEKLLHDLSYVVRTLLRNPGFTILAVVTLALGIGANTAIFTVINGVLLRPLPYSSPSQIMHLEQIATRLGHRPHWFLSAGGSGLSPAITLLFRSGRVPLHDLYASGSEGARACRNRRRLR